MSRRLTTWLTLVCYSVIALWGEGLHAWFHDHAAHDQHATQPVVTACHSPGHTHSHRHGNCHNHGHTVAEQAQPQDSQQPHEHDHEHHDSDNCVVCQHQALGQVLTAPVPAPSGPAASDERIAHRAQSAFCPALFSPSQPRAPPAGI